MPKVTTFLPMGYFGSTCYLVTGERSAVLIDPSVSYQAALSSEGGSLPDLCAILLTHAHFDHMLTLDEWCKKTGASVYVGAADAAALSDPAKNAYFAFTGEHRGYTGPYHAVYDGDSLVFGDLTLRVLALPGHTAGSVGYLFGEIAFTGDLVFEGGGYGRTDLYGGDLRTLYASLRTLAAQRGLKTLYPGHGAPVPFSQLASKF